MPSRGRHRLLRPQRRSPFAQAARLGPVIQTAVPALDPWMVGAVLVLAVLGVLNLVAIGDASLAVHQSASVVLGLGVLVWAWRVPSRWWTWLGRLAYAGSLLLLLAVKVHGIEAYGAKRWLDIGSFALQPSELAELGLVMVLAEVMSHQEWRELRRVGLTLALLIPPIGLTLMEPDLSTSALLFLIGVAALVLGRVRWRVLGGLALSGLVLLPIGLKLLRPYQIARLHSFLGGASGSSGGWTILQSHIAIASGGLLGIGKSSIGQLLSTYLPARETDLAFASLVEELGFVAGAIALLALVVLVWRLVVAATHARTRQGALIAGVMAVLVGGEATLSVGGNLGYLPLAGVPIPFLAYGGTVTVAHMAAFGIILGGRLDTERRRLWQLPQRLRQKPRLARTLAAGLALSLVALGALTYQLQKIDGGSLRQAALTEVTRYIPLTPERGLIEDRQGQVIAADPAEDEVVAVAQMVPSSRLSQLANMLGQGRSQLHHEMTGPTNGTYTVTLAAQLPANRAQVLRAADVPGVIVEPVLGRQYPYGSLLGPIVGYTGAQTQQEAKQLGHYLPPGDQVGQAGLEAQYNSLLSGTYGSQGVLVNAQGIPVAWGKTVPPVNGRNLVTGIDLKLQQVSTQLLQKAISGAYPGSQKGDEGAVVVMDPQNGQVLAMASWPAYNNQIFEPPRNSSAIEAMLKQPGSPLLEHATQTAMPPGSNFKLVVASADVYHHAIPTGEIIPTGGSFTYDGHTYNNWESLPPQDLPQAIAWSNDVYFYKLAVALGAQNLVSTAQTMGVGQPTGIDLPAENPGYLGTPSTVSKLGQTWYPGSTVIMGIGQGYVTATPVQDAVWTAAVGTGSLVTPRVGILQQTSSGGLQPVAQPTPKPLPWASELGPVRAGLRDAVTSGTADMLNSLGVDAGGKTGTAQDPTAPNGGPDAWFTAMAPMSNPQVVVSMLVRGGGQGYYTDQPAVQQILKYFFANQQQIMSTVSTAPPAPSPSESPTPPSPTPPAAQTPPASPAPTQAGGAVAVGHSVAAASKPRALDSTAAVLSAEARLRSDRVAG